MVVATKAVSIMSTEGDATSTVVNTGGVPTHMHQMLPKLLENQAPRSQGMKMRRRRRAQWGKQMEEHHCDTLDV